MHQHTQSHRAYPSTVQGRIRYILQWLTVIAVILLSTIFPIRSASADYVGTGSVKLSLDPASAPVVLNGYQNGDVVSYILQQAPKLINTGDVKGVVAYGTIYVPPGVKVVNAELVQFSGGVYTAIPAEDIAAAANGCGNRGCRTYAADMGNGKINEVQQDTGIFYSTDAQTALLATPLSIATTGSVPQTQSIHNQWDYNQIVAFGRGTPAALSGNTGRAIHPWWQRWTAVRPIKAPGLGSPVQTPTIPTTTIQPVAC